MRNFDTYGIPLKIVQWTEKVLQEYGNLSTPHEGLVYWAGIRTEKGYIVRMAYAPSTISEPFRVETTAQANIKYINALRQHGLVHIGQIHTHPGDFISHSEGDNYLIPFKKDGLLSVVSGHYGLKGLLPMNLCGVHIYADSLFYRVQERDVHKFITTPAINDVILIDDRE